MGFVLPAEAAAGVCHACAAFAVFGVTGTADFCRSLFGVGCERLVGFCFFYVVQLLFEELDLRLHLEGFNLHVGDLLAHGDLVGLSGRGGRWCPALLSQTADQEAEGKEESHQVGSGGTVGKFSVGDVSDRYPLGCLVGSRQDGCE